MAGGSGRPVGRVVAYPQALLAEIAPDGRGILEAAAAALAQWIRAKQWSIKAWEMGLERMAFPSRIAVR